MLRKPKNKLVELSMEETLELMSSIDDMEFKKIYEPFRKYVIDIYENYEFSYNEMKDLIRDVKNGAFDKTGIKILKEFTRTHDIHEGINKYIKDARVLSDTILKDIVNGRIPYDNTKDEDIFDFADKLAKQELRQCKVLRYSNKEMKELFGVESPTSSSVSNESKLNGLFTDIIAKATGDGTKGFSSALSSAFTDSIVGIIAKAIEGESPGFSGTPFLDVLKAYKEEYEIATDHRKEELLAEVAGHMRNILAK